jgi:hypothetical protein
VLGFKEQRLDDFVEMTDSSQPDDFVHSYLVKVFLIMHSFLSLQFDFLILSTH